MRSDGIVSAVNCPFLDDLTIEKLLAPLSRAEFREKYWEQRPLLLHRQNPNFYGNLFTLQDFDSAMAGAPPAIKAADAKNQKPTVAVNEGEKASGLQHSLEEMRKGATLILDQLHNREPKLGLLCRLLEQQLGHRFQTNIYLTPPNGQGFTPHWDNHDVFILQVLGCKHWKVEKQRRAFPTPADNMGLEGREIAPDPMTFTLSQGDMIYIPRGFVHAAECGAEPSLHITLGLMPVSWNDLLKAMFNAALPRNQSLVEALPLGFMNEPPELLVRGVKAALQEILNERNLKAVTEQFTDELVSRFPLDIAGQVTAFFQATQLESDDVVGPRLGIVFKMRVDGETVRIVFGGRTITFPDFLKEPLDFALNTRSFRIREIAGDLEDSEKLVFVERLMQEGLLVRK